MSKKGTPVNMNAAPKKPMWLLKFLQKCLVLVFSRTTVINKHGFKSFKEPTLIISNHSSFTDFGNIVKLTAPHHPGYVASIEEFVNRDWVMKNCGCFPKRKFTKEMLTPMHFNTIINKHHKSAVIFPEARFSFAGITERVDGSMGKLAKYLKCNVVVVIQHGAFLKSPQWNKRPYRKVRNVVDAYMIATKEETLSLSADEIQERFDKLFHYDEYKWQLDNKIKITSPFRTKNIERILYKCPVCGKEGYMTSTGTEIICKECHSKWKMDEYGVLHQENGETRFTSVADWYRWEREEVNKEVQNGTYVYEDDVVLKHLDSASTGFRRVGLVRYTQDDNGTKLEGTLDNGDRFHLVKKPSETPSIHIEFNYCKMGEAIDVNTLTDTWFAFPQSKMAKKLLMKINFAAEALAAKHPVEN